MKLLIFITIIDFQSVFRHKHFCETSLRLTLTKFKNVINLDNYVVALFLELRCALETIDRDIMLQKLQTYVIQGKILNWIKEYLTDRIQRVKISNSSSNQITNIHGVIQGSILVPLLFIVYMNDISLYINCDFINLFAANTLLVCKGIIRSDTIDINLLISKLNPYLTSNKLKFNVKKTKAMILTNQFKLI